MEETVQSPCQRICAVDGKTGLCMGCYRTMKEIGAWGRMDNEAKQDLLVELEARREEHGPIGYLATS